MKKIITFALMVSCHLSLSAQSADKTEGCVPLTVKFEAPQSSSYYWEFGDGTSSDKQVPEHIFTDPGDYSVVLYNNASKETEIGTIKIEVYPDIVVNIDSDNRTGCTPSSFSFNSNIAHHSKVNIEGYLWTFGEGGSSTDEEPDYTYNLIGVYDVSLAVKTNFQDCNKTIIEEEYITISEHEATFTLDKRQTCTVPATFTPTNTSEQIAGYTYNWFLDNELIDENYDPQPLEIDEFGKYRLKLVMTAPDGCEDSYQLSINVGEPQIQLSIEDTICTETPIPIDNFSIGSRHMWNFGPDASNPTSSSINPTVSYDVEGVKTVTYTVADGACSADTTFNILITNRLGGFTISPESICGDSVVITMTAEHDHLENYYWNGSETPEGPVKEFIHYNPVRDPYYINKEEDLMFSLSVESPLGCVDTTEYSFQAQLPEAFFIPDSVIGVGPLTIGFEDNSTSSDVIVWKEWRFGDGTVIEVDTSQKEIKHTFENPGKYEVTLVVRNEKGCMDISKPTEITVLGLDTNNYTGQIRDCFIGPGNGNGNCINGRSICVGEEIPFSIGFRSQLYRLHVYTDDGRFDHCWNDYEGSHTFLHPGRFPVIVSVEQQGFELFRDTLGYLNVDGARAEIDHNKNCTDIYDIELQHIGTPRAELNWYHNGKKISNEDLFNYTFDSKGEHEIVLSAESSSFKCGHTDTLQVVVTEPKSSFVLDDIICAGSNTILDATTSEDVREDCGLNYEWTFEDQRPRTVADPILEHQFVSGKQEVILTVTDVNGCTASSKKTIEAFGTEPDFSFPEALCLPHQEVFENLTTSDTTIIAWEWSFDSAEREPTHTFGEEYLDSAIVNVTLYTEDIFGCLDSIERQAKIYTPETQITLGASTICQGMETMISADEYEGAIGGLKYEWQFGEDMESDDRVNSVVFPEYGDQEISLIYYEEGTQCRDTLQTTVTVIKQPEADFISSIDGMEHICYPHTVEFQNTSDVQGNVYYTWDFGNGSTSNLINTAISYDRGTYTASLIAYSTAGCESTKSITFELIGPDGNVELDKDEICIGETINLKLTNPIDITEMIWDLGDGTIVRDQPTVEHVYSFKPESEATNIDLILKSAETGCELIKTVPISIHEVIADFEITDGIDYCRGLVGLSNMSIGGNTYTWDLDDDFSSDELHPVQRYDNVQDKNITLIARNNYGCESSVTKTVSLSDIDIEFYKFPNVFSPNGDGRNDEFKPFIPDDYKEVVKINTFKVFDRWGQLIHDDTDLNGWDGNFRGAEMPLDVYAYFIEMDIKDCKVVKQKGNVTIIK